MTKKTKKINPKDIQKNEIMTVVQNALVDAGYEVLDGDDFAMTKGTIVVRADKSDIQLKPIAPKHNVDRYEKVNDDAEQYKLGREISPFFLCILPIDKSRKM